MIIIVALCQLRGPNGDQQVEFTEFAEQTEQTVGSLQLDSDCHKDKLSCSSLAQYTVPCLL